jgi:hypothetical protein
MAFVELTLDGETYKAHSLSLRQACDRFSDIKPGTPYEVTSSVPAAIFQLFLEAIEGKDVEVTPTNVAGLGNLSREFGFWRLSAKVADYRVTAFESASAEHQVVTERRLGVLEAEVAVLKSELGRIPPGSPSWPAARDLPVEISALGSWVFPRLDSVIIVEYPALFAEFRGKQFNLLWRGSRDGFGGRDFHNRCDGHPNTLTVILDTKGNVFGGYTPTAWESPKGHRDKGDETLKSFIYTLRNPNGVSARKFALKAEEKHKAINCFPWRGPGFGSGCDLFVSNHSNTNAESSTTVGASYANNTEFDGDTLLTGSHFFIVAEIEVFEITE